MPAKPELTQIEKDKLAIDPNFDFRDIAQRPFKDITTNEIGMFKWSGVYHQLQKGFFMIRLRLPGGIMTSEQLNIAGTLADKYAQGQLCITTRQTLQFHWVRQEDIHKIMEGMQNVGISSQNACGDVTRNVVTCELQGVCPHEVGDILSTIEMIANDGEIKDEQRNLPRKHKISVSGCGRACGQTLMNCQGWYPVTRHNPEGDKERGWKFHAGGGLGARPYMAQLIFSWVPEDLVLEVVRASTEVYRRYGNRRLRAYARLKMVVDELGASGYADAVLAVLSERKIEGLERIEIAREPAHLEESFLDGQTVIPQRQKGFNAIRVLIDRSEISGLEAHRFSRWAKEFGNGSIMYTNRQNLILRFVPDHKVESALAAIRIAGYRLDGFERLADAVACVGTTMCNLAVSDTPNVYRMIMDELGKDRQLMEKVGHLRINMNGCPNSCAQHWIADIGLRGLRKREEIGSEDGFSIYVGGKLSGPGYIAHYLGDVISADVVPAIRRLLQVYLDNRSSANETFGAYVRRVAPEKLAELIGVRPFVEEPINIRNLRLEPVFNEVMREVEV